MEEREEREAIQGPHDAHHSHVFQPNHSCVYRLVLDLACTPLNLVARAKPYPSSSIRQKKLGLRTVPYTGYDRTVYASKS
jgi:hypothetical protein